MRYARRCSERREDGGEDTDQDLDDELPESFLGVLIGAVLVCSVRYRVCDYIGYRLFDKLLQKLVE